MQGSIATCNAQIRVLSLAKSTLPKPLVFLVGKITIDAQMRYYPSKKLGIGQ
jgi:hypothetical protein